MIICLAKIYIKEIFNNDDIPSKSILRAVF